MMYKSKPRRKINMFNIWICVVYLLALAKNNFSWKGVATVSNYTLPNLMRVTFGNNFMI